VKPLKAVDKARAFDLAVAGHLRERYRASRPASSWEGELLQTTAGLLSVRPMGTWIALRFSQPDRASALLSGEVQWGGLNPHSGKWNIHLSTSDLTANLAELDRKLGKVCLL